MLQVEATEIEEEEEEDDDVDDDCKSVWIAQKWDFNIFGWYLINLLIRLYPISIFQLCVYISSSQRHMNCQQTYTYTAVVGLESLQLR
jgi:hypothetical protein